MGILRDRNDIDDVTGEILESRVVRFLWPYLLHFKFTAIFTLVLIGITVSISLYIPRLLGHIVDNALLPRNSTILMQLSLLYLFLEVVKMAARFMEGYYLQKIGQGVMHSIRAELFGKMMRMPIPFYDRNPTGKLVTRITNDTVNLTEIFGSGFVTLIADIVIMAGVVISMIFLDWKLGLITISVFPLMMWAMNYFSAKLRLAYRDARHSLSSLNAFFAERMTGMSTVQLLAMEEYEQKKFKELSTDYFHKQMSSVYVFAYFHPSITVLSAISIALVLYFGGHFVGHNTLPIGVFVAFLAYVQILFQPVRSLTEKYNIYQNAMSSAERIFSLLKLDEEEGVRHGGNSLLRLRGEIEFRHVYFSYDKSDASLQSPTWALKDANFHIQPNERIAVVGHTGAGKSTLLSLLFRFYEPQMGDILIDGQDSKNLSKNFLRRRFGFVQQDVFIFAGTIRENLMLLGGNVSEAQMLAACTATGMDKIVMKLEQGYNTVLDERGSNLSLGERQVLAITRVFLQDPDVLILDEATSHVDSESERILQHAMDEITKNRTSLIIAHRLSTIRSADRILVFEKGQIVESGSHSQLIAKQGVFYQLSLSQS